MRLDTASYATGILVAFCAAGACKEPASVGDTSGAGGDFVGGNGGAGGEGRTGDANPLGTFALGGQAGTTAVGIDGGTGLCEVIHLNTNSVPPRVVFVQDVSSSMSGQWQPLHDAMVDIAKRFGDGLRLGLIPFASIYFDRVSDIRAYSASDFKTFFSAHDNDCDISSSSIIEPAPGNAAKIMALYDSVESSRMVGGTPTYAAMEKVRQILVDKSPHDGSVGYAILVTDGAPNCPSPTSNLVADVETSIRNLASAGVNTYIVGYNYSGSALDSWAAAGKTSKYYNANDTAKLNSAISGILVGLLSCDYALSSPVEKASFVRVTVDGKDRALNNATNGWTLGPDKKAITLTGAACDDLRLPGQHSVSVVVECGEVIIL